MIAALFLGLFIIQGLFSLNRKRLLSDNNRSNNRDSAITRQALEVAPVTHHQNVGNSQNLESFNAPSSLERVSQAIQLCYDYANEISRLPGMHGFNPWEHEEPEFFIPSKSTPVPGKDSSFNFYVVEDHRLYILYPAIHVPRT